jgi:phenazine biosynthesis protein PhzF family
MRRIPFYVLDSFTDTPFQGNPAGVFFDDHAALTADEMRRLAGEVSLESAFVLPDDTGGAHDYRLRYFTGSTEVPLCGHATLAAVTALAHAGRLAAGAGLRFATNPGTIAVTTGDLGGGALSVTQFQRAPEFGAALAEEAVAEVASALGCAPEAITGAGLPVRVVSTGTPWLYVPVTSRAAVDAAPASFAAITALSRAHNTFGLYVFAVEHEAGAGLVVWSRCFAPVAGLDEDPVTGSASGGLGAYLWAAGRLPAEGGGVFTARQGFAGGRGGTVHVRVKAADGAVTSVAVTGRAVLVAEGAFTLP